MNCLSRCLGTGFCARHLGLWLCLVCGLLPAFSLAAEAVAATPDGGTRFATVWRMRGEIAVNQRPLQEGSVIYVGERVRSSASAEAVLKTEDGGYVAIRPGTEFVAERFAAEGKSTDNFSVRLLTGSLRIITGWIGRLNRAEHRVLTPSATIGIRGTDHEPYVLSAELAAETANREGTYDKVNRGGTTLDVGEQKLDIDAGRVGFVRAPRPFKTRALMTILLPVLLEKVPSFYIPGEFDAELDRYSQTVDDDSQRQLQQLRKTADSAPAASCKPTAIARLWLKQLDGAIARRDAPAIVAMFAPDVAIQASVRSSDGEMTTVDLGREELAQSTIAAMKGLTGYRQRRVSIEGKLLDAEATAPCERIAVKSVVIEQGRQAGKPYRFESLEAYTLELQGGKWRAIKAETTQR
jgi:hypothetical protein